MSRDDTIPQAWLESLQRFVAGLRLRGLAVSQAEMIDAVRAAGAVGPEDRARLRAALSMTLAKDLRSREIFEEVFAGYFVSPPRSTGDGGRGDRGGAGEGEGEGRGSGTGRPPTTGARPRGRPEEDRPDRPGSSRQGPDASPSPRRSLRPLDRREILKTLTPPARPREGTSRREGKGRDRKDPHAPKPREPAGERSAASDAGRVGASASDAGRVGAPASAANESAAPARLRRVLAADRRPDVPLAPQGGSPRRTDLQRLDVTTHLTTEEERRLAEEIPRILQDLRLRRGRRKRRAARGRIWMKRVIRESLSAGGVPFRLPVHERIPRPPRIALVVDVSHSVARAAGLFLRLALELLALDGQTRVFLFVNHPVEGTAPLRAWLRGRRGIVSPPSLAGAGGAPPSTTGHPRDSPASRHAPGGSGVRFDPRSRGSRPGEGIVSPATGRSFLDTLRGIPGLDTEAPSDYGRTFYALASGPLRRLTRDTVLVVLGDGRTNVYDPLPWAFEEIAARVKRVIWLVPESRSRWGTGDSALPQYLRFCDVAIEATDLDGLTHGVRELVASL